MKLPWGAAAEKLDMSELPEKKRNAGPTAPSYTAGCRP